MSLESDMKMEEKAQEFVRLVKNRKKKDALTFFRNLHQDAQKYILKEYGTFHRAAQMQF